MANDIKAALKAGGWFQKAGAYVLLDGQYGSTGKGLATAMLAEMFHDHVDWVTTNAGPNSGHTSYYKGEKIVLKQLPTFPVIAAKIGKKIPIFLNAGAVINIERLNWETAEYLSENHPCGLHPHAVVVTPDTVDADKDTVSAIGSTGQGMGPAIAAKVQRKIEAVVDAHSSQIVRPWQRMAAIPVERPFCGLIEVSQGYSLGLNAGFYPYTTARNCDVNQALSDAGLHPVYLQQTMMVVRTYPIRVAGNSGPCYPDQREITWEELGQTPELTTVTKKVRRVFTWSELQFRDALRANRPEHIFVNFCNYLPRYEVNQFIREYVYDVYWDVMKAEPKSIILGWSERTGDCTLWQK